MSETTNDANGSADTPSPPQLHNGLFHVQSKDCRYTDEAIYSNYTYVRLVVSLVPWVCQCRRANSLSLSLGVVIGLDLTRSL